MNLVGLINQKHFATVNIVKAQYQKQTDAKIAGSTLARANAKQIPEQADISHIKTTQGRILDTYTLSTRVMSFEEFYELMTSYKSSREKHTALVEAYGNVLSFCAYEKGMQAIQNGTYSLEEFHVNMEVRHESSKTSMADMMIAFELACPNRAEVERSKELAKKFVPIQNKMLAGKLLNDAEKSFLREHFPEAYAKAMQIEEEVINLKNKLRAAKSKEEAAQIHMEAKLSALSAGVNDKSVLVMTPALDEAYNEFMKEKIFEDSNNSSGVNKTDLQDDAIAAEARRKMTAMKIAKRISNGDNVPMQDHRFLAEFDSNLYKAALKASMVADNDDPEDHDSLADELAATEAAIANRNSQSAELDTDNAIENLEESAIYTEEKSDD